MTDLERISQLLRHLDELRGRRVDQSQMAVHDASIEAVEAELCRLGRRVDRHQREGLVA